MNHLISPADVTDITQLVNDAAHLKANPYGFSELGKNKTIGLIFFNSSLRTRLSTQKAATNLGMNVIVMNVDSDGWQLEMNDGVIMDGDKAEHIREAAAVIGQYCDIIGVRAFAGLENRYQDYQETVMDKFRTYAGVPIINLESATRHPCQSLTDLLTIQELKTVERPKIVLTWAPHVKALPQAVANSFAEWVNLTDYELTIANPEKYNLAPEFVGKAKVMHNQEEAFAGADIIYTKNWSSYEHYGEVLPGNGDWRITAEKMALTNNAKFMHCLPVRRGLVVEDEVLDSPSSVVIQQAGNREWAAQAVIKRILEGLA
jgi:N-succinyl-L-ornithine transcarbamylase